MRVAFVSYEYPPDTSYGGIATYVAQIASCLVDAGIEVEVFCGSPLRSETVDMRGVRVTRIKGDRLTFPTAVVPPFLDRHRWHPFDVLEGPDFLAEARHVADALPNLPLVVRLHTPYFFAQRFGRFPVTLRNFREHLRLLWYALKTKDIRALESRDKSLFEAERHHLLRADEVSAPSHAIADLISREWKIASERISLVPFSYVPPTELLRIPVETHTDRVTFVGRLEWRKGVQDLACAIPLIRKRHPKARFRFVGAWGASPIPGVNMKNFLARKLRGHLSQLEFVGRVQLHHIATHLAETDICVFPSVWESFGMVVLEAMSAGRAVVCTGNAGMAEIIDHGKYGMMVPPKSPRQIADRVCRLIENPTLRHQLGRRAREHGIRRFDPEKIVSLQIESYHRAIARKQETPVYAQ